MYGLLISALGKFKICVMKPIFLDFGPPRGGSCMRGHGLLALHSSCTKLK